MRELLFGFSMILLLATSLFHILTDAQWISTASASDHSEQIIVENGETLWEIADRYNETNRLSIPDMVQLIQVENQLAGAFIYPGQVLKIPSTN